MFQRFTQAIGNALAQDLPTEREVAHKETVGVAEKQVGGAGADVDNEVVTAGTGVRQGEEIVFQNTGGGDAFRGETRRPDSSAKGFNRICFAGDKKHLNLDPIITNNLTVPNDFV